MKFHTQFDPPNSVGYDFSKDDSPVQSQFAEDCDINVMVAKLSRGDTSVLKSTGFFYGDISYAPESMAEMLTLQRNAAEIWNADENADIRARFLTPDKFLDFLADEKNREDAIKLGVLPQPAKVVTPEFVTPKGAEPSAATSTPLNT